MATQETTQNECYKTRIAQRGVLEVALGGRDEASLEPLLGFLVKYFSHPHFCSLLITVCEALLREYVLGD